MHRAQPFNGEHRAPPYRPLVIAVSTRSNHGLYYPVELQYCCACWGCPSLAQLCVKVWGYPNGALQVDKVKACSNDLFQRPIPPLSNRVGQFAKANQQHRYHTRRRKTTHDFLPGLSKTIDAFHGARVRGLAVVHHAPLVCSEHTIDTNIISCVMECGRTTSNNAEPWVSKY